MRKLVSILIPVFNAEHSIEAAIKSCLDQTYSEIEIIILDNGSNDKTSAILSQLKDERIQIHKEVSNRGIAPARNILLKLANGDFIAWLDADDLMLPERIEKQVQFLNQSPDVDILGTWIKTDSKDLPSKKLPLLHNEIKTCMWFKNCIIQPSVMSRNFYVKENVFYDEANKNTVEDYELWYRLVDIKTFANLPEYLTVYHLTEGIELELKKRQNDFNERLQALWETKWNAVAVDLKASDKLEFQSFLYHNQVLKFKQLNALSRVLIALKKQNNDPFFRLIIALHFLRLWNNMKWANKFLNLDLLSRLRLYPKMKKTFLI